MHIYIYIYIITIQGRGQVIEVCKENIFIIIVMRITFIEGQKLATNWFVQLASNSAAHVLAKAAVIHVIDSWRKLYLMSLILCLGSLLSLIF
jgi:hypothetical protein